ncbi:MAG: Na+/H+ antiporter subunit E [Planctomycetota bacterium]
MRKLSLFVTLYVFWLVLSGQFHNTFLMVVGAVCCAGVTAFSARMGIVDEEGHPIEWLARFVPYAAWLLWQILLSNIDVARRVWMPGSNISPRMVEVPYSTKTDVGTVTYANSITLTPGTVTVSVGEETLLVHALTEESAAALETGEMLERVLKLEGAS